MFDNDVKEFLVESYENLDQLDKDLMALAGSVEELEVRKAQCLERHEFWNTDLIDVATRRLILSLNSPT